jgi:hypothetical protein
VTHYLHDIPGRLRVQIPRLKNRPHRCETVTSLLTAVDGVNRVSANGLTGSLLVHYDTDAIDSHRILRRLADTGLFDESATVGVHHRMETAGSKATEAIGKAVFGWAVGRVLDANGLSFLSAII